MSKPYLIIDSRPRSGTHLLQRSLNTHEQIHILEEPFVHEGQVLPWDFTTRPDVWLRQHANHDAKLNGVIVQDYQFSQIPELASLSNLKPTVVILYRMDLLAQFVSLKIAQSLRNYETNAPRAAGVTLHVDLDEFHQHCQTLIEGLKASLTRWRRFQYLVLSYEFLTHDRQETMCSLSRLLRIDVTKTAVATFLQETRPMFMVVLNFHEIKRVSCLYEAEISRLLEWTNEMR